MHARPCEVNSCRRPSKWRGTARKKCWHDGLPLTSRATAHRMADTSWGLYAPRCPSVISRSAGKRCQRQGTSSFAYAHSMLAMFCGGSSVRRRTATSTMPSNRGECVRLTVANAQARFDSSWGLKFHSADSCTVTSASRRKRRSSWCRTRANAQAVFAMPWGPMFHVCCDSSRATLENRAAWCTFAVPKAQTIVERTCGLIWPGRRRNK
mmetsp:Transcript_30910/g.86864  ORF Transcript_30910/g.86864 Transcript_30910/m.86864 type:complete len:209 (-) Transcript_30910:494-1120(-)